MVHKFRRGYFDIHPEKRKIQQQKTRSDIIIDQVESGIDSFMKYYERAMWVIMPLFVIYMLIHMAAAGWI